MIKYSGFVENGYRIRVEVPTTIFEDKRAVITTYEFRRSGKEREVGRESIPLRSLPYWNVPLQAVLLRNQDQRALERKTNEILLQLPRLGAWKLVA